MIVIRIWVDDLRPAPKGYEWARSVNEAKEMIQLAERVYKGFGANVNIELLDLDHDSGDFSSEGGDYIKILDWMEETGRNYPVRLHTMNIVGRENMLRIANRNGWEVIP